MNYRRAYIPNSKLFITFVISKRRNILISNINLLRNSFKYAKTKVDFIIDGIVILPNHIHMIITPQDIKIYPEIIKKIKSHFSRNFDVNSINNYEISKSRESKKEKDIWQRRYYEHTIRNEKDLNTHLDYIHYNPIKHSYVKKAIDWQYSSFKKYVNLGMYDENWCQFVDELNYE